MVEQPYLCHLNKRTKNTEFLKNINELWFSVGSKVVFLQEEGGISRNEWIAWRKCTSSDFSFTSFNEVLSLGSEESEKDLKLLSWTTISFIIWELAYHWCWSPFHAPPAFMHILSDVLMCEHRLPNYMWQITGNVICDFCHVGVRCKQFKNN